jgi:Na+/melibiose symporter-like transporter
VTPTAERTRRRTARRTRVQHSAGRELSHEEHVRLALLALPTFALAFAITTVSAYLGQVTRSYTRDTIVIGVIIGGEGVMALWIPLLAGAWSDQLRTRIGGRLPFVLGGCVPAAVALILIGLVHSLLAVALAAAGFFAFYFVAYEPYRAMYPDIVKSSEVAGRAQSAQAVARGLGTGLALVGSGLLLSVGRAAPFVFAAALLLVSIGAFVYLVLRRGLESSARPSTADGPRDDTRRLLRLVAEHSSLRFYFVANALWEMALAALKAFIVLYLVQGLGYGLRTSSLIIGGVALVILLGAAVSGKLGDRFGRLRVVILAAWMYGLGFLVPVFTTARPAIGVATVPLALGGGTLMTLAYAILMPLMPKRNHGALTGFYSLSRGVGITTGPLIAGVLIAVTQHGPFSGTQGYQAMWIVCSAAALASLWFVRGMRRAVKDREQLRQL